MHENQSSRPSRCSGRLRSERMCMYVCLEAPPKHGRERCDTVWTKHIDDQKLSTACQAETDRAAVGNRTSQQRRKSRRDKSKSRRVREIVRQQLGELWFESVNNAQTLCEEDRTQSMQAECRGRRTDGGSQSKAVWQRNCKSEYHEKDDELEMNKFLKS
jgi:hypothetical protein